MKDTFLTFPEPLRKRILLQCAGAGLGITMLLILLVYVRDWYFLFPCAALVIVSLSGAASLYDRCRQKRYVTIEAACTDQPDAFPQADQIPVSAQRTVHHQTGRCPKNPWPCGWRYHDPVRFGQCRHI